MRIQRNADSLEAHGGTIYRDHYMLNVSTGVRMNRYGFMAALPALFLSSVSQAGISTSPFGGFTPLEIDILTSNGGISTSPFGGFTADITEIEVDVNGDGNWLTIETAIEDGLLAEGYQGIAWVNGEEVPVTILLGDENTVTVPDVSSSMLVITVDLD